MYEDLKKKAADRETAFLRLCEIVRVLRKECPWDREQTHQSLRVCMIEEAYEVAEAIDRGDAANLREELGDVMLQVIFHSLLGEETGAFTMTDVLNEECEKMIRRHPHVFLEEGTKSVDKVLEKWENIKVSESREQSYTSRLKKVPRALPALIRSYKVQAKAAQAGFDWEDASGAFEKLAEETQELVEACRNDDRQEMDEELGDLLFSVVNISRFVGIEPEEALERTIDKFIRRFQYVEESVARRGQSMDKMSLKELDMFWEEAKRREANQ